MNKRITAIIILLVGLLLAGPVQAAGSWVAQVSSTTESILNAVHFTSAANGWAVGDSGVILRTSNRGRTWETEVSGTGLDLKAVDFYSATAGWAVGSALTVAKYDGTSWTATKIPATAAPVDIDLADVKLTGASNVWVAAPGFTAGGSSTNFRNFFHSRNGGVSWEGANIQSAADVTNDVQNYFYSIFCWDDNTAWLSGINNATAQTGKIFKTTDAGATWLDVSPAGATGITFRDVYFVSASNGWAAGSNSTGVGSIYNTTDGGATWSLQYSPTATADFKRLSGPDVNNLWACDGGSIYNSTDGTDRTKWAINAAPAGAGRFNGIFFIDQGNGWAVGGLLPASAEAGGPKRSIYKYVISPSNLNADRTIYISPATYESKVAFYGSNIQSNSSLTLEARAGLTLLTAEARYDSILARNKFETTLRVDPTTAVAGSYTCYAFNPDEGTAGTGSFTLQASGAPVDKATVIGLPEGVFKPSTQNSLKFQVQHVTTSASGVRTSAIASNVDLELIVFRFDNSQIAYRKIFTANPSGYTTLTLNKITDLGVDISQGIYLAVVKDTRNGQLLGKPSQIVVDYGQ